MIISGEPTPVNPFSEVFHRHVPCARSPQSLMSLRGFTHRIVANPFRLHAIFSGLRQYTWSILMKRKPNNRYGYAKASPTNVRKIENKKALYASPIRIMGKRLSASPLLSRKPLASTKAYCALWLWSANADNPTLRIITPHACPLLTPCGPPSPMAESNRSPASLTSQTPTGG